MRVEIEPIESRHLTAVPLQRRSQLRRAGVVEFQPDRCRVRSCSLHVAQCTRLSHLGII